MNRSFFLFFFIIIWQLLFLPLFFLKTTLKRAFLYYSLAILDIFLLVEDGREEEISILGKSLVSMLLGEVGEQFLREGHILLVQKIDVVGILGQKVEGRFKECDIVL